LTAMNPGLAIGSISLGTTNYPSDGRGLGHMTKFKLCGPSYFSSNFVHM